MSLSFGSVLTMPIVTPPSLNTAGDLLRLRWSSTPNTTSLDSQGLSEARWLALSGIMQRSTDATLTLWEEAVKQGWDLHEGGAWVVHLNRGDLVRPLAERFGLDWAVEIDRPRSDLRGYETPLSGLEQALTSRVKYDEPTQGAWDETRAPSVLRAWMGLGLDPTRRVSTTLSIYAGMETPIKTRVQLPMPWLGLALSAGAWDVAETLLQDPRVRADVKGLSQALYAWTVSAWRHKNDPKHATLQPCEDLAWPQRLMALGAQAHPFAWEINEVETQRLNFRKETPSTHTWAQSWPQHAWLSSEEKDALEQRCSQAPCWSSAQWALRNAAVGILPNKAAWWSALSYDAVLWRNMALDDHGRTPLMIAMAQGEEPFRLGSMSHRTNTDAWQGESVVKTLLALRPQRTQDEVVGLLSIGIVAKKWAPFRLLQTCSAEIPVAGLFNDVELGRLIQTISTALFPVSEVSHHTKEHLNVWWKEEALGFVKWLAPSQHDVWNIWVQRMQESLSDGRFHRPDENQGASIVAMRSAWVEQRELWAVAATDEAVQRLSPTPTIERSLNVMRPRL